MLASDNAVASRVSTLKQRELFPPPLLERQKNKFVVTFTLFMLASNLSCCTTFLIAVMLEDPDIALFFIRSPTLWTIGGWVSRLTWDKSGDDHIRIPVNTNLQ